MKAYWWTVGLGLTLVATVNLWVDPSRRLLRRPKFSAAPPVASGQCLLVPADFDDRALRAAQLSRIERPDIVALGSSRVLLVGSSLLGSNLRVYNAGVAGATIEDLAALWQALVDDEKRPDRLLIFVDPWMFNENSRQIRWRSISGLVLRFLARRAGVDRSLLRLLLGRYARETAARWIRADELADLLSLDNLKASISALRAGGPPSSAAGILSVVSLKERPVESPAWAFDGSYLYPSSQLRPPSLGEARRRARVYVAEDVYGLARYRYDDVERTLLRELLLDARGAGTRVLLVSPPYHRVVLDALAARPGYRAAIPDAVKTLSGLALETGAAFCDATEPEASGCTETEFSDGMHMLPSCARKVVSRCLSSAAGWEDLARR